MNKQLLLVHVHCIYIFANRLNYVWATVNFTCLAFLHVQTYDVNNQLACLDAVWVSKAAARQRKGRAGRSARTLYIYIRNSVQPCVSEVGRLSM